MEASALHAPAALNRSRLSVSGPLLRLRSDEQLVALFRAGNEDAFQTIHDRYRQRMFAYCRQMLAGSRGDAEDATQDVFLKAFRALRSDDRPVTLRAWLYRVAHNRCIDQIRRPQPAQEDIFDMGRTPVADPFVETERREDLRRLVADIGRLPDAQRSALLMREMDGLSYQELAAALDVTVPAIKSLLVRARIGLVESIEARDTACADIRTDLVQSFDRGVRASGLAKRHMHECHGCSEYRTQLRTVQRSLNSLSPGGGPFTAIAKILGISGSAGGAAAGGGAAVGGTAAAGGAGGLSLVGGGAAAATACKVAAVVCSAVVITAGVGHEVERAVTQSSGGAAAEATTRLAPATGASPADGISHLRNVRAEGAGATHTTAAKDRKPTNVALRSVTPSTPQAETFITPDSDVYGAAPAVDPALTGGSVAPDEDGTDDPADNITGDDTNAGGGAVTGTVGALTGSGTGSGPSATTTGTSTGASSTQSGSSTSSPTSSGSTSGGSASTPSGTSGSVAASSPPTAPASSSPAPLVPALAPAPAAHG